MNHPVPPGTTLVKTSFWLARHTRTVFFFVAILTLAGAYLALQVPIAVFSLICYMGKLLIDTFFYDHYKS